MPAKSLFLYSLSMTKNEKTETPAQRLATVKRKIRWIRYAAVAVLALVLGLYLFRFHSGLSTQVSDFGQAGDFVGGFLNPLFAMGALFALLYTIVLQVEEMQDMRREFAKTVDAAKHQTFEATFFQMLRLHNDNVERISWIYQRIVESESGDGSFRKDKTTFTGREALEQFRAAMDKSFLIGPGEAIEDTPLEYMNRQCSSFFEKHAAALGTYFLTVFEILSLIKDYEEDDSDKYARLFATQLIEDELILIAYYCMANQRLSKALTGLIEFYAMLDSLPDTEIKRLLNLGHFEPSAFNLI